MQYISGSPWESVTVDKAGPFSRSESGNRWSPWTTFQNSRLADQQMMQNGQRFNFLIT